MKILAPIDKAEEVETLIKAGADELYCGLFWRDWLRKYPLVALSRRPASIANLKSFDKLREIVELAHSQNVCVTLAINEHYYIHEQYPLLFEYIQQAVGAGVDALIISDPALLIAIRESEIMVDLHLSTGVTVLNSETIKFFQDLGISRVTFERQMTIDELRRTTDNISGVETCVFVLNSRCPNIDGLCTFMHFQLADPSYKNACMLPYAYSPEGQKPQEAGGEESWEKGHLSWMRQQVWERHHMDDLPCGACVLYDLLHMGVDYIKIVGRGNKSWRKEADIKFFRMLLDILEDREITRQEFMERSRMLHANTYKFSCQTIRCYFPEVMAQREVLECQ